MRPVPVPGTSDARRASALSSRGLRRRAGRADVVGRLAHAYGDRLLGVHLNFLPLHLDMPFPAEATDEDRAYQEEIRHWQSQETGYS
jgi:hypothetical protein